MQAAPALAGAMKNGLRASVRSGFVFRAAAGRAFHALTQAPLLPARSFHSIDTLRSFVRPFARSFIRIVWSVRVVCRRCNGQERLCTAYSKKWFGVGAICERENGNNATTSSSDWLIGSLAMVDWG